MNIYIYIYIYIYILNNLLNSSTYGKGKKGILISCLGEIVVG